MKAPTYYRVLNSLLKNGVAQISDIRTAVVTSDPYLAAAEFEEPVPEGWVSTEALGVCAGSEQSFSPLKDPQTCPMPSKNLLAWLLRAMPTKEARFYLNGIYVSPSGTWIATDGHRLHTTRPIDPHDTKQGFILPATLAALLPALWADHPTLDVDRKAGRWRLETPSVILHGRLVDGRYPDCHRVVKQALPKTGATYWVRSSDLLAPLPPRPRPEQPCWLSVVGDALSLSLVKPAAPVVCLNQQYLKQAFLAASSRALLTLGGANDAVTVWDDEDYQAVVMPWI